MVIVEEERLAPGRVWQHALPAPATEDGLALQITIRRENSRLGGYGTHALFSLNGVPLDAAKNRYESRLRNKGHSFLRPDKKEVFWNQGDGIWLVIFAPDFTTPFDRYGPDEKDPYRYLIDISDLLISGRENTFSLTSTVPANTDAAVADLVFSVELVPLPASEVKKSPPAPKISAESPIHIDEAGSIHLSTEDKPISIRSSFSVPGGGKNYLQTDKVSKEDQWKPKISSLGEGRWKIVAKGQHYSLTRTVTRTAGRVQVSDTFENLTEEDIGILFSNELDLADQPGITRARIGGNRGQTLNEIRNPSNPTLFFPLDGSSLTLVAEDDFYRNQGTFFFDTEGKAAGIRDHLFALGPRDRYTLRWAIYTLDSEDYFDMINRLRADWGVNYPLRGPIYFTGYHSIAKQNVDQLRHLIGYHDARYIAFWELSTSEPVERWDQKHLLGRGVGMLKPEPELQEQIAIEKTAVTNFHEADPKVKIAPYTHAFFIAPEREDDLEFQDSWILNSHGNRMVSQYSSQRFYKDRTVYPTLTNRYGAAYLKLTDYLLDEMGFDWIYWDESDGPGMTQPGKEVHDDMDVPPNVTFNAWDGHSAVMDPKTGQLLRKFGILPILSDGIFEKVIEKVEARDAMIQFNGAPSTATRQNRASTQSFVETQWNIANTYRTHLSTPLAYGLGNPDMASLRRILDFGALYVRTNLNYDSDVVARFFPITPMELHEGWIKGEERIITNRSGKFGWDEAFAATLYLYDADAKLAKTLHFEKNMQPIEITVPEDGMGILEKK